MVIAPGHVLNDRYRIDARIGRGGMGVVYSAHDLQDDETVAIKVLSVPEGESSLRFRREFRVMAKLSHPNVIRVIESGAVGDLAFLVMEFLDGGTLGDVVSGPARDEADLARRLDLLAGVADALAYVHAQGIIHRDLKPDNVLMGSGEPHLMDFGLAKSDAKESVALTQEGDIMGTAPFMSPEQIRGKDVDHRSDLYAFGCMLYWSVVGEPPFTGDSFTDIVLKQIRDPAPAPSFRVPLAPQRLDAVVLTLLEKDAGERFTSASDVATRLRDIASILRGETSRTTRPTPFSTVVDTSVFDTSIDAGSTRFGTRRIQAIDTTPANLLRPPLIGRDDVWRQATATFDRLEELPTLVVEGDTGLGASRLLDDLAGEAAARGILVLRVRHQAGLNVPYHGFLAAFERLRKIDPATFAYATGGLEESLALLMHDAFPGIEVPALPTDVAQLRLYAAIDAAVSRLAQRRPSAIVVDDLHAADEGSMNLVRYLARSAFGADDGRTDAGRSALIVSIHPSAASRELMATVRQMDGEHVVLEPLDDESTGELVRALLGGHVDPQLERHVVRRSGGNPFFVHELLGALLRDGHISRRDESWAWSRAIADLPPSIEAVFAQRIEALDDDVRATAAAASTIGVQFAFDVLQTLLNVDEDDLLDELEVLTRAGIVAEGRRDTYRFTHPLLRDIVHEGLSPRRRRRFHASLAAALQATDDASSDVLALHFAEAGRSNEAAVHAMKAAAAAEAVFANDVAERFYRLVLSVFADEGDAADPATDGDQREPHVVSDARLALAKVLDRIGRWSEAETVFEAAIDVPRTHDEGLKAFGRHLFKRGDLTACERAFREALEQDPADLETLRTLGRALMTRGAFDEAREVLHSALGHALPRAEEEPTELAMCQVELGYLDFRTGALDTALDWYSTARSVLTGRDDPLLSARIDQVSGLVHYMRGNLHEAERSFRASYEAYERAGDVALAVSALYNVGMVYEETGAMSRAADTFKEIRTRAHRIGDEENEARASATWGWLLQRQGRGDEAVTELVRARDHFYARGNDATGLQVHMNAVVTLARFERLDEALDEWDKAAQVVARVESTPYVEALSDLTLGELRLRQGLGADALSILTRARDRFAAQNLRQEAMESSLLLAETHLALRDVASCHEALAHAAQVADELSDTSWRVLVAFLTAASRGDANALREASDDMQERNLQSYGQRVLATVRAHAP